MKILKILGLVVLVVMVLAGAGITVLAVKKPAQRPAPTVKVEITPERLARGKYLVENVVDCIGCHSDHDWDKYTMPIKPGTLGQGGFTFDEKLGMPGSVSAQNITPDKEFGLGDWTDGEILRAIREGVSQDGHALFGMMPYKQMRMMGDEDAFSVVAYLRSLPPIKKDTPPVRLNFPINLLMKLDPQPLDGPVVAPKPSDGVAYGKYMVMMAGCWECHSPPDGKGGKLPGMEFSGGWEMKLPGGRVVTANITPDDETGIGKLTKEAFIGRFKAFENQEPPAAPKGRNTIMPWYSFARMTTEDLGAIYDFLRTLKPIKNKVNHFPDAT